MKIRINPVLPQVHCLIEEGDITPAHLETFSDFWAQIDVINAYEDGWEKDKRKWKKHYADAYATIKEEKERTR